MAAPEATGTTAGASLRHTEASCGVRFRVLRWAAAFTLGLVILVGYTLISTWNVDRFLDGGLATRALWTRLDRAVPTVPEAIWPYGLYYVLVMMPMFAVRRSRELGEVLTAYLFVTVSAWVAYAVWPVRMEYPHLVCGGRFSCEVLLRLWSMDMGVNVMPSLHAAHSALAAAIFWSYRNKAWPLIAVGAAAVSVAAVLTRQHYILDIVAGVALALVGWALVRLMFAALVPVREPARRAVAE
jgi:membrane-associated phospholipid phosphatase